MRGMKTLVAVLLAIGAVACGARVEGDPIDAGGGDDDVADARSDGPPGLPDGPPPDAAPCTGGTSQATSGTTCYEAFQALPQTWAAAQATCASRGGALVKIESAAENAIITTLAADQRAWIGGSDLAAEDTFVWTDGTPFVYTNWRSGEPNNGNDNFQEDCALIEGPGTWDDRPCDDMVPGAGVPGLYFFICERSI
jgi:hypothetical protein